MRRLFFTLFMLILLPTILQAQEQNINLDNIQRATVFIYQSTPDLNVTCVGTGTIVRYDGLILTNAHNTVESAECPGNTLIIAMSLNVDEAPVPKYRAQIVQANEGVDLAILQINQELDGRTIDANNFPALPFVELADSDSLELDQTVRLVGYASLENEPSSIIRASVTSFLSEPVGGNRAWAKFSPVLPVAGTMSGGGAYDSQGRLIGVPTTAPIIGGAGSQCNFISDTNNDGFVNRNDRCVPVGDFLTVMRPANFARILVRSASLGLQVDKLTSPDFQLGDRDEPSFSRLFFAPSVVDGLASTVIGSLPSGADSLYLVFDYSNMTPRTIYEMRVTFDGLPQPNLSLPPVRWSGGQNGIWYIGNAGQTFANGTYEFRLFIDGELAEQTSIVVSGTAVSAPTFSNIAFGLLSDLGVLQGNGYVLPTGGTATAQFIYQNMEPDTPWTVVWYFNDTLVTRVDATWNADDGTDGAYPVSLQPAGGLVAGRYRVELYIGGRLSTTGDFVITGSQESALPRVFSDLEFYRSNSANALPTSNPSTTFPDGAAALFTVFDWEQIATGTPWTLELIVDDEVFYQETVPWTIIETGNDFTVRLTARAGEIPDGTYIANLYVNGVLLQTSEATVGIGQLPIDQLATGTGITMRGQVLDGVTFEGIEGATVYLISEDYAVADFEYLDQQLYALTVTDRDGRFEIDRPLLLDTPYSVLVESRGFLPVGGDGFTLDVDTGNVVNISVIMTRD